jgi:integrase
MRDPGGKQRSKTFDTVKEARDWLARGQLDPDSLMQGKRPLADVWQDLLRREGSEWKATTLANWEQQWRKHICPALGAWPVGKITVPAVKDFLADLGDEGVGAPTRQKVRSVLHRILQAAVEDREIPSNPVAAPGTRIKGTAPRDPRHLTVDEARLVLETAQRILGANDALAIEALFSLGLRSCEMAGLQARDLDWGRRELTVRRSVVEVRGRLVVQESTKTRHIHVIPLPEDFAFATRLRRFLVAEGRIGEAHVFQSARGGPIRTGNWRRRIWYRVMREIEIDNPPGTHAGRRAAISLLQSDGVPMLTIGKTVGHRSPQQTAGYVGVARNDRGKSLTKLAEILGTDGPEPWREALP